VSLLSHDNSKDKFNITSQVKYIPVKA